MEIYERYVKIRDSLGLKDADVARISNVPPSTFTDWKKGKSKPKSEKLDKIAKALNVQPTELKYGMKITQGGFDEETMLKIEQGMEQAQVDREYTRLAKEFYGKYLAKNKTIRKTIDMLLNGDEEE